MLRLVRSLVLSAALVLALAASASAASAAKVKVIGVALGNVLEVPGTNTFCAVGVNKKLLPGAVGVLCYRGTSTGSVVAKSYVVALAATATKSQAQILQVTAKGALSSVYRTPAAVSASVKVVKLATNEIALLPDERMTCNVPPVATGGTPSIVCIVIASAKTGALRPSSYSIPAEDAGVAVGKISANGKSQTLITEKKNP